MSRAPSKPILRCALYTRVSTEHGLEQDFNSLDAQREAAEAYVRSQAQEGWKALATAYDDAGYSGGTMERPALQRLLADIRAGRIDIVVVYKVDRLTRSLADFAKLVELFDAHGVSFVSVTQQFNTTTSMGRLTLNVLLSFAQFEREVTGERIRDKIAASKKKGLWMGGMPPLGYEVRDRGLHPVESQAALVRSIFALYLEQGSVGALKAELDRRGIVAPARGAATDRRRKGGPFSRGHLYRILSNPVYIGQIAHREGRYPGQHAALIAPQVWEAVQRQLASHVQAHSQRRHASEALLMGRLFDERGNRMSPSYACKGSRRYRYYISQALVQGREEKAGAVARVSAPEVETVVLAALRERVLGSGMEEGAEPLSDRAIIDRCLERAILHRSSIELVLQNEPAPQGLVLVPWSPTSDVRRREVIAPGEASGTPPKSMPSDVRRTLLVSIAKARVWMGELTSGRMDLAGIASREGRSERSVRMLLPLAGLAPEIVVAAIQNRLPDGFGVSRLIADLPLSWAEQCRMLGLPVRA